MSILRLLIALAAWALAGLTFLPMLRSDAWWLRMMDFPRLQYLAVLAVLALLLLVLPRDRGVGARRLAQRWVLAAVVLLAIGYNGWKLAPYAPGSAGEAPGSCPEGRGLTVMASNVRFGRHEAQPLLDLVRRRRPDVLLALETDDWWDRQLGTLDGLMPNGVQFITGSYFGIHMLSRLPVSEGGTPLPVEQDAPAVSAVLTLPGGEEVRFLGIHPRPPHPGQSSTGRDAQLMWGAVQAAEDARPTVIAGDLNTVPWETSFELMQRVGHLIDPRDAYGFIPSYDARSWWMRWPLDHVLASPALEITGFERLPDIGSDHYPVLAHLCLRDAGRDAPARQAGDMEQARAIIDAALKSPPEEVGDGE